MTTNGENSTNVRTAHFDPLIITQSCTSLLDLSNITRGRKLGTMRVHMVWSALGHVSRRDHTSLCTPSFAARRGCDMWPLVIFAQVLPLPMKVSNPLIGVNAADTFLFNRYTRKAHRRSENSHEGKPSICPSVIIPIFFRSEQGYDGIHYTAGAWCYIF